MLRSASIHVPHRKLSLASVVYQIDQLSCAYTFSAMQTHCYTIDMSTPAREISDFIQQYVEQQGTYQAACCRLTGEKGYHSVESGPRHHFVIGLVIEVEDKTVQMQITKGHHYQALAPLHQYVLDALGFEQGRGPVFNYEDTDAVILHSNLAAAVIDTLLSLQKAMSATKLRQAW